MKPTYYFLLSLFALSLLPQKIPASALSNWKHKQLPHQLTQTMLNDTLVSGLHHMEQPELQQAIAAALSKGDTLNALHKMLQLADLLANASNYGQAYDRYWEALSIAEAMNSQPMAARVYHGLGWLYSLFKKSDNAIGYFKRALKIEWRLEGSPNFQPQFILDNYYALSTYYRKLKDLNMASRYLDTCIFINNQYKLSKNNLAYINAEQGYILHLKGLNTEALEALEPLKQHFKNNLPSYMVILNAFLGEIYHSLQQNKMAVMQYNEALEVGYLYKRHIDMLPGIYEKLSVACFALKDYQTAYNHLVTAKKLNEAQFGSHSDANQKLFTIKDSYREAKEAQVKMLQEQKINQLLADTQINQLKVVILVSSLLFLAILAALVFRNLRLKHRSEKQLMQRKRALEIQKSEEVLEVKNKELTASALKAIERESLLTEIKDKVKALQKKPDELELGRLAKRIESKKASEWEAFHIRFMAVNKGFYERLKRKYPNLSQNDHKLCALIKLNFSSKEMAGLMGISTESVHTTRYRLRKRLGLQRQDNLEEVIANI